MWVFLSLANRRPGRLCSANQRPEQRYDLPGGEKSPCQHLVCRLCKCGDFLGELSVYAASLAVKGDRERVGRRREGVGWTKLGPRSARQREATWRLTKPNPRAQTREGDDRNEANSSLHRNSSPHGFTVELQVASAEHYKCKLSR